MKILLLLCSKAAKATLGDYSINLIYYFKDYMYQKEGNTIEVYTEILVAVNHQ